MKAAIALLLATSSAAAYTDKATVTIGNVTFSDLSGFSAPFTGSAAALKAGRIKSTSVRNGITVPNDFVFTDDSSCASITGSYTWEIETWDSTAGTITGWIRIPFLLSFSFVPRIICTGKASDTWHGGAAGAAYDSNTKLVYHFADASTLGYDSGAAANNLSLSGSPSAIAGKIGGGGGFASTNQYAGPAGGSASAVANGSNSTVSGWIYVVGNSAKDTNPVTLFGTDTTYPYYTIGVALYTNGSTAGLIDNDTSTYSPASGVLSTGIWHYVATTFSGTSVAYYVDGALVGATSRTTTLSAATLYLQNIDRHSNVNFDELRLATASRSAAWIAAEYATQNSPAIISVFTPVSSSEQPFIF